MSQLILIRHGQASFFEANYDKLSPLGEEQAIRLGKHWIETEVTFDEIFTGPRKRQKDTATLVGSIYREAGIMWPTPVESDDFDEHQVDRLLRNSKSNLYPRYPHVAKLGAALESAAGPREVQRAFQKLFEAVMKLWLETAPEVEWVESWDQFRSRVDSGLNRILGNKVRGRRIGVFTSVGAVSVSLLKALGCTASKALDLGWRVRNTSLTEFVFSGERFSLDQFNCLPHLPDRKLWTFR